LSRVEKLSREEIKELESMFSAGSIDVNQISADSNAKYDSSSGSVSLNDEQEKVVEAIRDYVSIEDQLPSKNKVIENSPFGSSRTNRILSELQEAGALETEEQRRYGNVATVFIVNI